MITFKFMIASFMMMLLMGSVYAYSILRVEIEIEFMVSTVLSGLPYMAFLFFYALAMMLTGLFLKPVNVKFFSFIGGVLIILGFLFSFFVQSI